MIVAAGRGSRAGRGGLAPKQYARVGDCSVLTRTIAAFATHPLVGPLLVAIHPDDMRLYEEAVKGFGGRVLPAVFGAATRQGSVRLGLEALSTHAPDAVLIHDAARPFVDDDLITRVIGALKSAPGAIAAEPLADTLKRAKRDGTVEATVAREGFWRAQTPQGFLFSTILDAHRRAAEEGRDDFTDDAALAEWVGAPVTLVVGSSRNIKLTTAEDLLMADRLISGPVPAALEPRIGTGFDVHKFTAGDHVWLCGVRIPHEAALEGHSDADAPLHALTDALLGALGAGDIGQHFPPTDPQWRGARSRLFVDDAVRRVTAKGGRIVNVDITILCEAPRIGPFRSEMQAEVAGMLGVELERVGIKATTTETLGFTGRREGLAAMASAVILLPVQ